MAWFVKYRLSIGGLATCPQLCPHLILWSLAIMLPVLTVTFFLKIFKCLFYESVFSCLCANASLLCVALRKVLDPKELELWMVASHNVGARNQSRELCKGKIFS